MNVTGAADRPFEHRRESVGARLLGFVLRPTAPPLKIGIAVALGCIAAESLLVHFLQKVAPESTFGTVFLLGVLVVSAGWDMRLSVATSLLTALVYVHFHMETHGALMPIYSEDIASIAVFIPVALLANILVGQARLRTAEAEQRTVEADRAAAAAQEAQKLIEASHAEVSELAAQQAALRRSRPWWRAGLRPRRSIPRRSTNSRPVSAWTTWRCCSSPATAPLPCWHHATPQAHRNSLSANVSRSTGTP